VLLSDKAFDAFLRGWSLRRISSIR